MEASQILVVDYNPEIRTIVNILLAGEGYEITEAANGQEALACLHAKSFDLIILDVMMPGMDGYQTCINIRTKSNAPILFLSARTQDGDKTLGFQSGGDDYLAKPFSYNELLERVKALIRRYKVYQGISEADKKAVHAGPGSPKEESGSKETPDLPSGQVLKRGRFQVWEAQQRVFFDEEEIDLTTTEYEILVLLMKHEKQIFSASHLYESIWQEPYYYGAENTIMVHIRNLRKKIEKNPQNPKIIRTIWGRGYRFDG